MKQYATAQTDESDNLSLAGSTGGNLADYGELTRLEHNLLNFVAGEPASQNYLTLRATCQTIRIIPFGYLSNT